MSGNKHQDRIIHIVVVGVSGPESLRGAVGVGKSALCNRFVRHLADEYQPDDHISTISQSDFSGRVINNDHFLYWGNVSKRNEDGAEVHFSIIEQTEFVDDQSFAPLRGSNTQQYHKRCAVTKLTSAEKLMYICKYQLGEEDGYEKKVLPEPKFVVDGYIMVFDVNSKVKGRPIQKQLEFLGILHQTIKKKPILVVATKCDEADDHYLKEARAFAQKIKANIVETSAHEAVNIDLAFMTLAQQIDKTKGKPREVPFSEAIKVRKELLDRITDSYTQLLKRDVMNYHALWNSKSKTYQKTSQPYIAYVKHLGTASARKLFERHRKKLKEEHLRKKQLQYLDTLPRALEDIFPDLGSIGDRTWEECKQNLNEHLKFQQWFTILDEEWKYSPYIDSQDLQIPYDFLDTNNEECKNKFNKHVDTLVAAKRKERMKAEFRKLLGALKDVVIPGRKIEDTYTHLADEESFRELTESERKVIYDSHQDQIKKRATHSFMEMLYERADLFERFENMDRGNYVDEAREVEEALQSEKRYQALSELKNERIVLLYKHIAFMHNPTKDTCPSKEKCMDTLIQSCIEGSVPKSPVRNPEHKWSDTNSKLNVVLLGEDGLADQLANEIRAQSCNDEYTLDGALHSLDLRCIEGDVTQPRNHLATDYFTPQGFICTFTSPLSFQYIKTCLENTLLASSNDDRQASLRNLPVVLMYAKDVSVPDSDLWHLKEDATRLQERLNQCLVVEMPTDETVIWAGRKFHESQIQKAISFIVNTKKLSEGLENNDGLDDDEPDLRIGMALMCGDQFLPDLVLGPLVGQDTCFQTPDLEQSITVDMFLGTERKKIDVDVMSYHQNTLYRDDIHHGYILVYSTKRKASFETMRTFLDTVEHLRVPTLIVGVLDMDKEDYETQVLRLEGHKLAESKEYCKFMPAGPQIQGQPLAFSVFLKEVYDKRNETEEMYEFVPDLSGLDTRLPARTPSLSEDDQMYVLPQSYRTPDSKVSTLPERPLPITHAVSLQLHYHGEQEEDHLRDRSHSVDDANTAIAHDHLVKPSEIRSRLKHQFASVKGYDSETPYDSFNRPSPFMRTPMQSVPIKGGNHPTYGVVNKSSTVPRRHSDIFGIPTMEGAGELSSPSTSDDEVQDNYAHLDQARMPNTTAMTKYASSTDIVEGAYESVTWVTEHRGSHKRSGSHGHVMSSTGQQGDNGEEMYARVDKSRPPIPTPTSTSTPVKGSEGELYAQVDKTRKPPDSLTTEKSSNGDEGELYAQVNKPRKPLYSPSSTPEKGINEDEGELYAKVDKTRKPSGFSTPEKGSNGDEDEATSPIRSLESGLRLISGMFSADTTYSTSGGSEQEGELYAQVDKSRNRQPPKAATNGQDNTKGWTDNSIYDSAGPPPNQHHQRRSLPPDDPNALYAVVPRIAGDGDEQSGMTQNPIYDSVEQQQQPKKKPPPPPIKPKPQRLNMKKYEQVTNTINRNRDTINRNRDSINSRNPINRNRDTINRNQDANRNREMINRNRDTINRNRDNLRPNDLLFMARNRSNAPLATPEKDAYSYPVDAVRYDAVRGIVGNSDYSEPYNALAPGLRQRLKGKSPSIGDSSPNDGDLHTPPGLLSSGGSKKGKKKPIVPPRSSIKSPPSLPADSALINELRGVIGEDPSRRVINEDPTRHTSSDSDSRSSMDAIAREPSKRKRSVRRRKVPRTRIAQFDYEPGMEYSLQERIYEPMPVSPAAVEHGEALNVKKNEKQKSKEEREERNRIKKEERRQRKLREHQAREQARRDKLLKKQGRKHDAPPPQQKPKGPPIETLVTSGIKIPPFVVCCTKYIEHEGKRIEGVYRVPGKGIDSDALIAQFEKDNNLEIAEMEISVHAVATAIKSFFSQLPEPLVPRATQEEFLNRFRVIGNENFRSALPELMNKLPEVNRDVFAFMMLHLHQIMQESDVNKMTAENLSTCWWPTLLQPQYKSLEDMANHAPLQNVVITCIQDAPELFGHMEFFPPPPPQIQEGEEGMIEDDRPEAPAESDASMTVEE